MTKLSIIEFKSFNLKAQLYLLSEDGKLISIVRISSSDCSLHLIYDFYLLLIYDIKKKCVLVLDPITKECWNKTFAVFFIEN